MSPESSRYANAYNNFKYNKLNWSVNSIKYYLVYRFKDNSIDEKDD